MKKEWVDRLAEAIEADGRSMRAISLDAGLGPNFAQQVVTRKRDPKAEPLGQLLDQLPEDVAVYVMTGLSITRRDLMAVQRLSQMTPEARQTFENLLDQLASGEAL